MQKSSMLRHVLPDASEADLKLVLKELEDPSTLYKFSGDKKVLVDIFKSTITRKKDEPKKVQVVQKIGPDAYVMMANSLEHFRPTMDIVGTSELVDFTQKNGLPSEFLREVEDSGESGVVIDWTSTRKGPVLGEMQRVEKFTKVTDPGLFGVYTKEGYVNCVLTNRHYNPTSDATSTGTWHMISNVGGGPQSGEVYAKPIRSVPLEDRKPIAGDYGYFIYVDVENEEDPMVVGPYEIVAASYEGGREMTKVDGENETLWTSMRLTARGPDMTKIVIGFSQDIKAFASTSKKAMSGTFVFPTDNMAWIPMKKNLEAKKPPEEIEKTASIQYDGMFYEVNGVDGLPTDWRVLDSDAKMVFVMRCCDMGMEKIAECMSSVKKKKVVHVPMSLSKKAIEKKANIDLLTTGEKRQLVKLASFFDDMSTVDSVLSLNFVNSDNIEKFTQSLDKFISVKEELLRLLLLSRIGNIEVSEGVLKQAIDILGKVIDGLQRLKAKK